MKLHRGKGCVEKFAELNEDEVKRLYTIFPKQPMVEFTDVLTREDKEAKNVISVLKILMILRIKREET